MTGFERDKEVTFSYIDKNGSRPMARAYWNLVISIRDVGLFTKGIKPNRHWRFNVVKQYFGVKGNKDKVYEQLNQMLEDYKLELLTKNN